MGRSVQALPQVLVDMAPPCFIYYDRHVEKNAGSTMRVLMKRLEEHGECAYWGYFQSDQAWSTAMALQHFTESAAPPRLCVEAHTGPDASARLVQLSGLKRALQERGSSCRVLRTLRVRDPVSHYLSFFTWGVTQRSTLNAQDARLFLSWANATPNLQSSILLSPRAGRVAAGKQGKFYPNPLPSTPTPNPNPNPNPRRARSTRRWQRRCAGRRPSCRSRTESTTGEGMMPRLTSSWDDPRMS